MSVNGKIHDSLLALICVVKRFLFINKDLTAGGKYETKEVSLQRRCRKLSFLLGSLRENPSLYWSCGASISRSEIGSDRDRGEYQARLDMFEPKARLSHKLCGLEQDDEEILCSMKTSQSGS